MTLRITIYRLQTYAVVIVRKQSDYDPDHILKPLVSSTPKNTNRCLDLCDPDSSFLIDFGMLV